MKIETSVLDIIEGRRRASLAKILLDGLGYIYQAGSFLHNFFYDHLRARVNLELPVISVGNIVAGGTGKTPFVAYLAETLLPKKVAILSRGYRRKGKGTLRVQLDSDPRVCGDEPFLLASQLPKASVIVGKDRVRAGSLAKELGMDIAILDDGLQYRRLDRDVEIVVIDTDQPFGFGHFLPGGLLRDSPKSLRRADLIVTMQVEDLAAFERLKNLIRPYTQASLVAMDLIVKNKEQVAGKKVVAFCGIGRPFRFKKTLERIGCQVIAFETKGDHLPFHLGQLERLCAQYPKASCLVCTEKDRVKLPKNLSLPLPLVPLEIALTPYWGEEHLKHLLDGVVS